MARYDFENSPGIVARVDDNSVARFGVSDNVAIAPQHANGEDFVDEVRGIRHENKYNIQGRGFSRACFTGCEKVDSR